MCSIGMKLAHVFRMYIFPLCYTGALGVCVWHIDAQG